MRWLSRTALGADDGSGLTQQQRAVGLACERGGWTVPRCRRLRRAVDRHGPADVGLQLRLSWEQLQLDESALEL